ncbi:pyrroloquinoline-quinone glucose dehydrogenase [Bisbaumannia pacifica]|uniref:Pyrroloquinoline-quinone glucose dehydrogenase n=1 Tax=Bisbaumannia pacifica TaxID=77098 RepID=A0A510XCM6_9GAMM|nr:PQQ-dependent sugar dehydrogenase [Halomonas pacifica]GEK46270.1 pyrroloquinoline-quinone glucose dehydrogenase [Halomonas pacifica]
MRLFRVLIAGLLAAPLSLPAAEVVHEHLTSDHHDFRLVRLADGLNHPWSLALLPDGRLLVSERGGRLWLLEGDTRRALDGLPAVSARGQGGLLDLALPPDFGGGDGDNDWLYFTYSRPGPGGSATALARARLGDAGLTELATLFVQDRYSDPGRHYGGRLAFLPDGSLAMSIGDRGRDPSRAQDGGDHAGGVLRLSQEGGVPADNPFVDDDAVLDELYSLGNRNIQGLTVDGEGRLWASEHGPRGGDELNRIEAGANYGWPEVSRGRDYVTFLPIGDDSRPGMRDPVHVFEGRFAPSGLAWVSGDAFPGWRGHLLAGGLRSERLVRLVVDGDRVVEREVLLEGEIGRIRDVRVGPDGRIYLLSDASDGGLYRLEPRA